MSTLFIEGMQPLLLRSAPLFITKRRRYFSTRLLQSFSPTKVYVKAFRMAYAQIV